MLYFTMNGYRWTVIFVKPSDPMLIDRTGTLTVATTDPMTSYIYVSNAIYGKFLQKVLAHELGHAAMFSYGLIGDLHRMVRPEYWIEAEEWVCNFIADYGHRIFDISDDILKEVN